MLLDKVSNNKGFLQMLLSQPMITNRQDREKAKEVKSQMMLLWMYTDKFWSLWMLNVDTKRRINQKWMRNSSEKTFFKEQNLAWSKGQKGWRMPKRHTSKKVKNVIVSYLKAIKAKNKVLETVL